MLRFLLLLVSLGVASADEHWFVFDQNQFPGFYTPLFTLTAPTQSKLGQDEQKNLSFALSTFERAMMIDVTIGNSNGTRRQHEQLIKLNVERADLLYNTFNHLIFVAVRQRTKLETYVNCKLMDSYLLYSPSFADDEDDDDDDLEKSAWVKTNDSTDGIQHFHTTADEHYHQELFDRFGCKSTGVVQLANNRTTTIGRPLIRKMQHVIEKVQRRKQRGRRHPHQQQSSAALFTDSLTIIYKPNIHQRDATEIVFTNIVNVPSLAFQIRYYPNEHLFHIRFNNENRTQFILYADKATDLVTARGTANGSVSNNSPGSNLVLFLHITPTVISCYVNCELTDQEFIIDSTYVQSIIRQTMQRTIHHHGSEQKPLTEYNRRSTLILFNRSIEQVAENFLCLKLDKKNEEILPDKYALRKFANALDMLVNSLDSPMNMNFQNDPMQATATGSGRAQNVAAVNIHSMNGPDRFGASYLNNQLNTATGVTVPYDRSCMTDDDCSSTNTLMKCQQNHCICDTRYFWSAMSRRCVSCKDLSVGHRCFRLSSHKSTWHEANDHCQEESSPDDQQEYTMKLASNLNRTDIELLKQSLLKEDDGEQQDYFYWLGSTSQFDTRKLHTPNSRTKRRVPTTIFRWYDNGEMALLNTPDMWCSQTDHGSSATINNNELCVSLTSCGLYADDCQRNYRFLCEAV